MVDRHGRGGVDDYPQGIVRTGSQDVKERLPPPPYWRTGLVNGVSHSGIDQQVQTTFKYSYLCEYVKRNFWRVGTSGAAAGEFVVDIAVGRGNRLAATL